MKKITFFSIIFIVLLAAGFQTSQYARRIFPVVALPATCFENSITYNMTDHKPYICTDVGWQDMLAGGGGGGGTITSINGLTAATQIFATGVAGVDFSIISSSSTHTFNFPNSSASARGLLTAADWTNFNSKQAGLGFTPENIANKNLTNGYAGLSGGKIAAGQMQEVLSVADLLEYTNNSGSGSTAIRATISSPSSGQLLKWDGSNWVNDNPLITSVFGRSGVVTAQTGDYVAAQVTNAFDKTLPATLSTASNQGAPSAGFVTVWVDGIDKVFKARDADNNLSLTVRPIACTSTDKLRAIGSDGIAICAADQTGAGSGIITLNALNDTNQTFSRVNDTNVTLTITSALTDHQFAIGWTGTLAKARMAATTVHTDQTNTFGAFLQRFQAGANFELLDPTDTTKATRFDLSNISTGTTRTVTIANASSTTVIADTGAANNFLTAISATGVISKAQPSFSNLSGSATDAQVPDTLTISAISNLTSNGYIKTSGGNGTLGITATIPITDGGTGQTTALAAFNALSPLTTKGDIVVRDSTNNIRLPVGTNGQCLTADSAQTSGLLWGSCGTGTGISTLNTLTATTQTFADVDDTNVTLTIGSVTSTHTFTLGWAGTLAKARQHANTLYTDDIQTVTAAKTFDPAKLIVGSTATAPAVVIGGFYMDTDDKKLYWGVDDPTTDFWGEVFVAGLSLVNLTSNVTGALPIANGGTGQTTQTAAFNALDPLTTKGDVITHDGTNSIRFAVGTNGNCLKANSAQTSGLEWGTCGSGAGDVTGPASSTDNAIARFDGTTGKIIQNSGVTIDDSNNISTAGNISVGVGGSVAGFIELVQGTAPTLGTTSVMLYAPTSVTSYAIVYPSAAATGIPHFSNSSNVITMTISAINLASADITGTLAVGNGGSGATTLTGILKGNGTSAFTAATAGTDYTSPSSTESFTNKTFDVEGTGNLFTIPKRAWFDAAACSGTTAALNWDAPTSAAPTASCTGTTTTVGAADFVDGSTTGMTRSIKLPSSFSTGGNLDINLTWFANAASSNAVRWSVSIGCVADSEAVNTGPSYNTASASNTSYTGTANQRKTTSFTNITKTNCAADETAWIRVERIGGDAGDTLTATAELLGVEVIFRVTE